MIKAHYLPTREALLSAYMLLDLHQKINKKANTKAYLIWIERESMCNFGYNADIFLSYITELNE